MIVYGPIVLKKKQDLWQRMERLVKKTKHLQLVGKERRRGSFIRRTMEIDRTTEAMEDRTTEVKEDRTTGMIEDLMTGDSIEDLTEEDKTEDLILKTSNALVAKDMVM